MLITGATGFIGHRLTEALTSAGHDVIVLARDPAKAATLRPPFRLVTQLDQIANDSVIDTVINFAGEPVANGTSGTLFSSISLARHVRCVRWTCPIGAVIGAGPKQSILLNVAALRVSVREMESTSHDPFATLAAFGCGRTGSTRHNLAGNALHLRAGAIAR